MFVAARIDQPKPDNRYSNRWQNPMKAPVREQQPGSSVLMHPAIFFHPTENDALVQPKLLHKKYPG